MKTEHTLMLIHQSKMLLLITSTKEVCFITIRLSVCLQDKARIDPADFY